MFPYMRLSITFAQSLYLCSVCTNLVSEGLAGSKKKERRIEATGVPTDAAFTSQVPYKGERSLTGDPPPDERARLQTCPCWDPWKTLQASGTTNNAACVTATGVPTDAAFTSQVPSVGESSSTGVPPDTGREWLQTCPEAPSPPPPPPPPPLDGTRVHRS